MSPSIPSPNKAFTSYELYAALTVVVLWGLNFVVMKWVLVELTPFQMGAARYLFAVLPLVLFVKPPRIAPRWVVLYGLFQGLGQFGFVFTALKVGMTGSLASVLAQSQVFFTALLAVLVLGEKINQALKLGLVFATLGLACFIYAILQSGSQGGVTLLGLVLNLCGAAMWAVSNIVARMAGSDAARKGMASYDPLAFIVWSSCVPIIPFMVLSYLFDPIESRTHWLAAPWTAWAGVAFLGWAATVVGYGLWTWLFKRHPANRVAPFSLGVPLVGLTSGVLLLNESISPWQWGGVAGVVLALMIVVGSGLRKIEAAPATIKHE